ncbi:formate dehydrogenase accessory sulfurtransferase FdhD [Methanobrevibacter arboriphilus]|nr:formate dehydrogenase accessory sulfurtransferase FdhD [Methanobrevibacter arboriphilus]
MKKKNEFISREDISRHVAVDKVIGAAALKKT